ncbi:MAG: phage holin family protein [Pontixanthobacter sp.]
MLDAEYDDRTTINDGEPVDTVETTASAGSLTDDISAFYDDGKTYVSAELQYQKTRLAFAADRTKSGAVYLFAGLAFLHLALIGLVIGLIMSLATLVGPFGATAIVVLVLLVAAGFVLFLAKSKFSAMSKALKESGRER